MKRTFSGRAVYGFVGLFSTLLLFNHSASSTVSAQQNTLNNTVTNKPSNEVPVSNVHTLNTHSNLNTQGAGNKTMGSALRSRTSAQPAMVQQAMPSPAAAVLKSFTIGDRSVPRVDAVDIASYQSALTQTDYNEMKKKGVKTVIVKVSEGTGYVNPAAATQIQRAKKAGLQIAVYHYALFANKGTAASEAQKTAKTMQALGLPKTTRIFADMEDSATNVSAVGTNLGQYWTTLKSLGYTNHAVYTGGSWGPAYASATAATVGSNKTWYAAYPYTPNAGSTLQNFVGLNYGAWQFSSTAHLSTRSGLNLDVSTDYSGVLTNLGTTTYDTITSKQKIGLPGKIDQSKRADGFYSAPFNTNSATKTPNSNARAFNGRTVQVLEKAVTTRSSASGNQFYKIRLADGRTFWTDTRAVKVGQFDKVLTSKSLNHPARIKQNNRSDGLYPDGPFNTSLGNIYENHNAPGYNGQLVTVMAEKTTKRGAFTQIKMSNGRLLWIDSRGLQGIYDTVHSSQNVNLVGRIQQQGRSDGLYSAPYRTSAKSAYINHDAKKRNGQAVAILKKVVTSRPQGEGNVFYQVKFVDGTISWIDAKGVGLVNNLNQVVKTEAVNLTGIITQDKRRDGLYSAPWNTNYLTITENNNAKMFANQPVKIITKKTTSRSASAGNVFYEIVLNNGRHFWIDARGVRVAGKVQHETKVSYDAQIIQSGRRDGLYAHPFNSHADSMRQNFDAASYAGRGVKAQVEGTTSSGVYVQVKLPDGKVRWIDKKALKKITYDRITSQRNLNRRARIVQTSRKDGLYSSSYGTNAMSILENNNAKTFNGQTVTIIKEATTSRSSVSGNHFYEIRLSNGTTHWIDARGVVLL